MKTMRDLGTKDDVIPRVVNGRGCTTNGNLDNIPPPRALPWHQTRCDFTLLFHGRGSTTHYSRQESPDEAVFFRGSTTLKTTLGVTPSMRFCSPRDVPAAFPRVEVASRPHQGESRVDAGESIQI